jgi:hypothetical protein
MMGGIEKRLSLVGDINDKIKEQKKDGEKK